VDRQTISLDSASISSFSPGRMEFTLTAAPADRPEKARTQGID
jgi:hypothetical protein